jgi:hypothetical protein
MRFVALSDSCARVSRNAKTQRLLTLAIGTINGSRASDRAVSPQGRPGWPGTGSCRPG